MKTVIEDKIVSLRYFDYDGVLKVSELTGLNECDIQFEIEQDNFYLTQFEDGRFDLCCEASECTLIPFEEFERLLGY